MQLKVFEGCEDQFISELEYELKVDGEEARFVLQYLKLPKDFYIRNYQYVINYLQIEDLLDDDIYSEELGEKFIYDKHYCKHAIALLKDCNLLTEKLKNIIKLNQL